MAPYPHLAEVAAVVRSHHERPDGHGYPDGLMGSQIPLTASIVSAVDAWDAMVSDRPYRAGMAHERAKAILAEGAGSQWLPGAVDALLTEVHTGGVIVVPRFDAIGARAGAD
ncbi:MAG: HD-GYP domain-containing protein, partial [Thermoleophilaceae bacterium]